ncbi:MAG: hypothetical protein ORN50_04710 [Crocinitomicaceae bacterium]|nr:hypothetical protein [Crocinitomicaceae bacterium]
MPNTILTDNQINQMIDDVIADNGPESITSEADNQLRKAIYANIKKLTGEKILIDYSIDNPMTEENVLVIELPPLEKDRLVNVQLLCFGMGFSDDGISAGSGNCIIQNSVYRFKQADPQPDWRGNFYQPGNNPNIGLNSDIHAQITGDEIDGIKYIVIRGINMSPYPAIFTGHVTINFSNL